MILNLVKYDGQNFCAKNCYSQQEQVVTLVADLVWTLVLESQATSLSKDLANDE